MPGEYAPTAVRPSGRNHRGVYRKSLYGKERKKAMKFFSHEKIRKWGRRTMALVCALGSMLSLNIGAATAAESSADVLSECVNGVIVLFRWDPIIDTYNVPAGEYYVAMLSEKKQ